MTSAVSALTSETARASRQGLNRLACRAWTARRTFSSADRVGNKLVIWNERPTPAAQIRSGASPAIERPFKVTVPSSGTYMPEIRLKAVVLPAPFGPMRAWSERSRTAMSTPWTALMPPKCFAIPWATRIGPSMRSAGRSVGGGGLPARHGGVLDGFRAERPQNPLGDADEAGGREDDEADEQEAEPEQPV